MNGDLNGELRAALSARIFGTQDFVQKRRIFAL
jgi:hypothetical protein